MNSEKRRAIIEAVEGHDRDLLQEIETLRAERDEAVEKLNEAKMLMQETVDSFHAFLARMEVRP